ncbi:MAG TPA: sensor histidine kinase [Candidatus Saccharimonadales bacterium]|nr:sensor histidine kinase [Candidatus Saccharimonadales bacterium]
MSIVQKIILWFLGLILVPTLLVGGILFLGFRHYMIDQAVSGLAYQADVQQQRIEDVVSQNATQLAGFTSRVLLPMALDRYNHSHSAADLSLLYSTISTAKSQTPKYQDISILNLDGRVIVSTLASAAGQDYSTKNYFAEAKVKNDATNYLFIDSDGGLSIDLVGPIMFQNKPVGIVVIDASAANLSSIVTDYSGLGTTGETDLAQRQTNGAALYLAPLRFDKIAALKRVERNQASPIIQAVNGRAETLSDAINYRNKSVIAITRPIKGTNWGITVETERSEIYQPLYNLRDTLLLLMFVVLVFGVFVALFAARLITDPIITLSIAAKALSKGDLSQRVDHQSKVNDNNEFGILTHAFNSMANHLEKLDKMKTEFILLTSHQLRTPASAVKGFLSLLLENSDKPLSAKQKELLESAYKENEQQLRLVNQILSIAQAESDQMVLSKSATDLVKLTKDIAEQLGPIALEHRQKITVRSSKDSIVATVDPEKMHMVVENLVSNALKYSPDKAEIKVLLEPETDLVVIKVQDRGYGISQGDMDQLFKKFSRLPNPNSVTAQGSGLGLYLVKKLIELHAGTIEVKSVAGQGTTFIVTLPYS